MRTMTCKQMGGECNKKISALTSASMANKMTKHVMAAHPKTAKKFQTMSKTAHAKWEKEFHKNWDKSKK